MNLIYYYFAPKFTTFVCLCLYIMIIHTTDAQMPKMLHKPGCNQSEVIRIDRIIASILPLGRFGRPVPETAKQLQRFCTESNALTTTVDEFMKRCFNQDLLQSSKLALYPVNKSVQQFCPKSKKNSKNKRRTDILIKSSACLSKEVKKNDTCIRKFLENLQTITLTVKNDKLKIPYVCW